MKIGVLTLTLHTNYGGILQAFALQTVLERMGHKVEVLNRPFLPSKTRWRDIPKRIIKKLLGRDVVIFSERRYNKEAPVINKGIWDFRKKYIHERIINSLHEIKETDYDCIVVGSDQVWRPCYFKAQWNTGIEDAYLAFTKGWNIKRIVYAASFGVDTWEYTEEETIRCREAAKMLDVVSVREESGVTLLKRYLDIESSNVLDPTMLLEKDIYIDLANKEPKSKGNMLIYLLNPTVNKKKLVESIAKQRDLKPFSVNEKMIKETSSVEKRTAPSVECWLKGFEDAEFVITDSFHACVFSVIFGKDFVVMKNDKRGTGRIVSFLKKLNMESNLLESDHNKNFEYKTKSSSRLTQILNKEKMFSLRVLAEI